MSAPHFPYAPQGAQYQPPATNPMATAGLVLSLIGLPLCWIPVVNFLGVLVSVVGIVLATVGLVRSRTARTGKGLSIAGVVLGGLGLVMAVVVNVAFFNAVEDPEVPTSTVASAPEPAASAGSETEPEDTTVVVEPEESFRNGVLRTEDVRIKITEHRIIPPGAEGNEYGDKPVIAFWYRITNLSGERTTPMEWIFLMSAYQDNNPNAENELDIASLPDDRFLATQTERIKKGGTVENAMAYQLDDLTTPVDLVANDSLGFGDDIGRVTYRLK